ncbi:MAG TPA: LysM peptidoglycan-binding domain-containing M23 family metallopeptidase [Bacteroidales bacterium]|jgi:murein DD-endopeptidase MepM/ murein hydrolase activator NlpD|nr:LysM peptidoglycan-binding domain-containing M23 family metallopeptidase [Bacteroidales bacterium]
MKKDVFLVIIASIIVVAIVYLYNTKVNPKEISKKIDEFVEPELEKKYGFVVDSFLILSDTVRPGETLGTIMSKYGITAIEVDRISKMSCDTFNLTLLHVGQPYTVFQDTLCDSIAKTKYFVYENGNVVYTLYDFSKADTIHALKLRKNVDTLQKSASGIIDYSLWNTLNDQGINWQLAIAMSQTFAWTIDFYGLQKGDAFKVLYTELFVEDNSIGIDEVKAGLFIHNEREFWAIPFTMDSCNQMFFDKEGNSVQKTFLKAPLKYTAISSRYSHARMHPIFHKVTEHLAVDYSAPMGTPIYSASDGTIVFRGWGTGAGNMVKVRHNSVYSTVYMHMSRFGDYNVGDYVKMGDVIGYVGSTGWSTGPHLHYEIHENGYKIDPLLFEAPPAEPVPPEQMDRFNKEKQKWIDEINKIEFPTLEI